MFNVLIIEENQQVALSYGTFLEKHGFNVLTASSGLEVAPLFESSHIDILLCELALTSIDGFALLHAIRQKHPELPIMALTKLGDFQSKQRAYAMDIDDYMVKPVDLNELSLRIPALLRRAHSVSKRRLVVGNAVLDSNTLTVVEGSDSVVLPPKEFMILFKLCSSLGRIFTRRDILDDVWGIHTESGERTVDVHIKRLRKRFQHSKSFSIETVRGVGYKASAR